MKSLGSILKDIEIQQFVGSQDKEILGLAIDSRMVCKSSLFIALKGTSLDGHTFIENAIELGATAVVCEQLPVELQMNVSYIRVENVQNVYGILASNYFDNPSEKLRIIGITGTNGKTTVASLLFNLFTDFGFKCGLVSTIENKIGNEIMPSTHTTPNAISLHELFAKMVSNGCTFCFMEVSSHAIHQNRIGGVIFEVAVFTNITHDHLDYHLSFDNYLKAKKAFFDHLGQNAFALINKDDRNGQVMLQNTKAIKKTFSLKSTSDFKGKIISNTLEGLLVDINGTQFHSRLVGEFNAYNLLAVYGTAVLLGFEKGEILLKLSNLSAADGRFQLVQDRQSERFGIVDYAHTPDALEKIVHTIKDIKPKASRLITVVGCGGDRDKAKRPLMGKIAAMNSAVAIFTSDNPRSEEANDIIEEMYAGVGQMEQSKVIKISDRVQAIKTACMLSLNNDVILVAGKGHEKFQEIKGKKYPFDDMEILKNEMRESAKNKF